jgi:hypothetical protein
MVELNVPLPISISPQPTTFAQDYVTLHEGGVLIECTRPVAVPRPAG